jgi:preprotein translocase subunit YajC
MIQFALLFQGGIGGLGGALLPMLLIFGVFYLLLIRPQQKKQRQLQAQIADLKAGDKIVTTGGIIGTITAVKDTSFLVRSAEKSILEIARSAVAGIDVEETK